MVADSIAPSTEKLNLEQVSPFTFEDKVKSPFSDSQSIQIWPLLPVDLVTLPFKGIPLKITTTSSFIFISLVKVKALVL